jgi:hypothetical protein
MRTTAIHKRSLVSVVAALCLLGVPFGLAGADGADTSPPVARFLPCWFPVDPIPVDETTDTTVEETTDETSDTTVDETTDTTVEETTDTTVEETVEETTDETTDTTVEETIDETTVEGTLPYYPCWYGPVGPYCGNWPQIMVDPPFEEPTDPTDTTVEETTDETTVEETTEETTDETTVEGTLPYYPCWYGPVGPYCGNWPQIMVDPPFEEPTDPTVTIEPQEPPFIEEPTDPTVTIEPQEPPFIEEPTHPTVTAVLPPWPSKIYCLRTLPVPGTPLGVSDDGSMSITGISPSVLPADESFDGGLITIYGTGFRAGSTVMIGEEECTSVDIVDEFSLTCDPPSGEISVRDVVVIDPDGVSVTAPASFEFMDPAGFWELPLYAFSSNPFERSTTVEDSADEDLAASGTSDDVAVPVFTGW